MAKDLGLSPRNDRGGRASYGATAKTHVGLVQEGGRVFAAHESLSLAATGMVPLAVFFLAVFGGQWLS